MSITIPTYKGTYIVPENKQDQLIAWLEQNAVNVQQRVTEVQETTNNTPRFLINEVI
jgi:hypothetical protein